MRIVENTLWTPPRPAGTGLEYFSGKPLNIGTRKQLLAHGGLVEDRRDVVRRVTKPRRHPMPVLTAEYPWEYSSVFGSQILRDKAAGKLRMWYGTLPPIPPGGPIPPYTLLYAESEDGWRWKKPLLGIVPDGDHPRTNILYRGANNNCSAFRIVTDPDETEPSRKYKMLHKGAMNATGGEELALSPDGLNWSPYEGNPVMPHRHDCNLNLLYDTSRRVWTAFLRPYAFSTGQWPEHGKGHFRRRVAISESRDLIHWSKLRTVLVPEEGDKNEFDNISIFSYGDVLVGMVGIFSEETGHQSEQRMHVELAFSTDGCRWERVPGNPQFLTPTGTPGDFDCDSVGVTSSALIDEANGEILIYYTGSSWEEGKALDSRSAVGILHLDTDRFTEQHADKEGGWLLTREFLLEGDSLEINCRAKGYVKAELAEYPGQAVPGFSLEECDKITGDHLSRVVTWRGGQRDLSGLRGRLVYVRFNMKDAGIWSFTVRDTHKKK